MRRNSTANVLSGMFGLGLFYVAGIVAIILLYVIVSFGPHLIRTTLPIMGKYEYVVDKYGTIHSTECPRRKNRWFKVKHKKYDIIMETDQEICSECLLFEENKLRLLHQHNLKEEVYRLIRGGSEDTYIENYIKTHSPEFD